jgi:hypothetical protein
MSALPLVSLSIFDGIPPQEEGQDPSVFYYWSAEKISKDSQFNEIGLYLTFLGFCREFRASKDCQYFQTDRFFTCFANLDGSVFAAACFDVAPPNAPRSPRVFLAAMQLFASLYIMRSPEFNRQVIFDLQRVFCRMPFLAKLPPSLELWHCCQEAIAESMQSVPIMRGAAFLFEDSLVHTSLDPRDVIAISIAYRAEVEAFCSFGGRRGVPPNQVIWGLGPLPDDKISTRTHPPKVTLSDGPGYPVILIYNELSAIIAIAQPPTLGLEHFAQLNTVFGAFMGPVCEKCKRVYGGEANGSMEFLRADGMVVLTKPIRGKGRFSDREKVDSMLRFLDDQDSGFIRACIQVGQPSGWLFMEKADEQATLVSSAQPAGPLADVVPEFVKQLGSENLG